MTKVHKYIIQTLAILLYGILLFTQGDIINPYFYLVVLCVVEIAVTLLYIFLNRKTISKDESTWDFISIYAYIVVIIIVSMFFLL